MQIPHVRLVLLVAALALYFVDAEICKSKLNKMYYFTNLRVVNSLAHDLCARNQMRMASIQSDEERIAFEQGLELHGFDNDFVWIAVKIEAERSPPYVWLWKSGDELVSRQLMDYTNWAEGFPDMTPAYRHDTCVSTSFKRHGWKWANNRCNVFANVACEKLLG